MLDVESFIVITIRRFFNMTSDRIEKEININKNNSSFSKRKSNV
jgi:hypothetical protein